METFGARLKELRELRGMSQEQLGFEMEVSKATISKWENDRTEPGFQHLRRLADLFQAEGASVDYLVIGENPVRVQEIIDVYQCGHRMAVWSEQEETLLARFRALPPSKKAALVELLTPTKGATSRG